MRRLFCLCALALVPLGVRACSFSTASASPNSGPVTGGNTVTITITSGSCTSFSAATGVQFGGVNATSFTVVSSTQITAVVPAGSLGTVDITVINAYPFPFTISGGYTYVAVAATGVPALSVTGLACLALLLAASGLIVIRQRRGGIRA